MTSSASPRVTAYALLTAVFAAGRARAAPAGARRAGGALRAAAGARPPARRGRRGSASRLTIERERALEQDEVDVEIVVSHAPAGRAPRAHARRAGRARGRLGESSQSPPARLGRRPHAPADACAAFAGATTTSAGSACAARDRLGLLVWEAQLDRQQALRVYPLPETLQQIVQPVATQPFTGNEVARAEGRRARVRRPAAVRARRPRSLDQLAGDRAPRDAARRQRAPSGAERRRDPLPRHVRGCPGRRPLDARPRRARDVDARVALPRAARPRRPRLVRRVAELARRPGWGPPSATGSSTRCSSPRSSSTTPGRTSRSFPRGRCRRRRSCSPSRRCSTPRAAAALARPARRAATTSRSIEVSPVPFVEPGASELDQLAYRLWLLHRAGAARPLRAARRRGRNVVGRGSRRQRLARSCARGGEGIPASRSARARIATGAAAVALAGGARHVARVHRRRAVPRAR